MNLHLLLLAVGAMDAAREQAQREPHRVPGAPEPLLPLDLLPQAQARAVPPPRYRCPKCGEGSDRSRRCRPCNVRMSRVGRARQ